jgi:hypothetical protein
MPLILSWFFASHFPNAFAVLKERIGGSFLSEDLFSALL